jgi:hypothetical protein
LYLSPPHTGGREPKCTSWKSSITINTASLDQLCHILPTYAQDDIFLSRVFRDTTDAAVFGNFIAHLLQHCGRWPESKSVPVMHITSFHHPEQIALETPSLN